MIDPNAPAESTPTPRRKRRAIQSVRLGSAILLASLALIASPLLLGSTGPMKYVVAIGALGACIGLSSLLHGAWDLLRPK
jgi:hypothetical protein